MIAANATTTEDAVLESVIRNSTEGEPTEGETAEGDSFVGDSTEGDPAMEAPGVDGVEVTESDLDVCDLDKSDDEVSDLDEPCGFEEYYSNLFKFDLNKFTIKEFTVDKAFVNEFYQNKLKQFVNYIDKCNSEQHFIVKMHTKSVYDLEPLPEEPSALQLGRFTDKLMLHVWVLQMLDSQDVDRWSGLLIHLISNKLDPKTRNLWNTFVQNYKISEHGQNVTMTVMLEFLRATCHEYEIREPSRSFDCITCIYNDLSLK